LISEQDLVAHEIRGENPTSGRRLHRTRRPSFLTVALFATLVVGSRSV